MKSPLSSRLLVFLLANAVAAAASADPSLVRVTGKVEVGHGTPPVWRAAKSGEEIAFGDSVRTREGARAELSLGDGRVVRVYERSLLRIGTETTPTGAARSVALDEGESLFEVMKKAVADEFEVRTPEIIVSVKGTRFLVAATPGPDFTSVFRGVVAMNGGGLDEVLVRAGFTGAQGDVLVNSFEDPWSAWETGAPPPEPAVGQRRADEVKGAVLAMREGQGPGPASVKSNEGKDDLAPGKDHGAGDMMSEPPLDPIEDIARRGNGNGNEDDDSLLDTVIRGNGNGGGNGSGGGNGNGNGGADDAPLPFTFDVVTSGGPNTVTVGFGGESVTLDQDGVDALLQGDNSVLGSFNGVVNSLGVDTDDLAEYLDDLI
jgi:hypothetical protein